MTSEVDWEEVGKRIKKLRRDRGLTQEQLVDMMESPGRARMSPSTLSIIENGSKKKDGSIKNIPRASTIHKIASALGVKYEDLIQGAAEPEEPLVPQESVSNETPREEGPSPSLKDIREMLSRYGPLRGMDTAVDRICEQIHLWAAFRGTEDSFTEDHANDSNGDNQV